jgi:hypothetical protein
MTTPKPGPRMNYAAIEDGGSAPKPSAKASGLHAQILASLLDNKPRQLANSVSEFNVNVAAKRWMP